MSDVGPASFYSRGDWYDDDAVYGMDAGQGHVGRGETTAARRWQRWGDGGCRGPYRPQGRQPREYHQSEDWNRAAWRQDASRGLQWCPDDGWGSASTTSGDRREGAGVPRQAPGIDPEQCHPGDGTGATSTSVSGPTTRSNGAIPEENSRAPAEKMVVPSFSGELTGETEDLGTSARSYLRQVAAWQRMTRLGRDKQGLVLYQNLTAKAWIEAERLDMHKLNSLGGVDYLVQWIKDRYLDVQVTQVGRSLSDFFRKLRKKPNQAIRDYVGEFDRSYARLVECGCTLPDIAAAWVFVDRMGLEEASELNLLASVGNCYDLRRLQQAAIVQDRALRKPWETGKASGDRNHKREWWGKKTHSANHTVDDASQDLDDPYGEDDEGDAASAVPESVAEELYQAFMTHESAKQCRCEARTAMRSRSWPVSAFVLPRPRASVLGANAEGTGTRTRSAP